MKNKRPFAPSIINKLDEHLLINNPTVWSTRIHMVLYYGMLFLLFLFGLSWLVPNDARNNTNIGVWSTLIATVSLISIVFWIIYLLRFNVFKRFGTQKRGDALLNFLFYFIAIGVFVLAPFVPSYVETLRAQKAYSKKEIYTDIDNVNTMICQLEYDSIPHRWNSRVYYLEHSDSSTHLNHSNSTPSVEDNDEVTVSSSNVLDSAEFESTIRQADSAVMLGKVVVKIYECPNYHFLAPYQINSENHIIATYSNANVDELSSMSSKDLFYKVIKNYKKPDTLLVKKQLNALIKKYTSNEDAQAYKSYYESVDVVDYFPKMTRKYALREMDDSINNIVSKQDRWQEYGWELFLRVFYYVTISLTLLLFVFRHSTAKTFFLTLLTAIILTIITTLILATGSSDSDFGFGLCLFYYLIFAGISIAVNSNSTRHSVTGIAINLFVFSTMYIPLLIVGWYYAIQDRHEYSTRANSYYSQKQLHFLIAEIAGAVLLLALIETVFKPLYRKWWAQPEN